MFVRWWRREASHYLPAEDSPRVPLHSFTVQLQLVIIHVVAETKVDQQQLQVTEQRKIRNVSKRN